MGASISGMLESHEAGADNLVEAAVGSTLNFTKTLSGYGEFRVRKGDAGYTAREGNLGVRWKFWTFFPGQRSEPSRRFVSREFPGPPHRLGASKANENKAKAPDSKSRGLSLLCTLAGGYFQFPTSARRRFAYVS